MTFAWLAKNLPMNGKTKVDAKFASAIMVIAVISIIDELTIL